MNKNNINFKVRRTREGTLFEVVSGVFLVLSSALGIVLLCKLHTAGFPSLIQTAVMGMGCLLMLVLAYQPQTFNVPDDSPAEVYVATVRFLRITAVFLAVLSLSINVSVLFNADARHLSNAFGLLLVLLTCWYFVVCMRAKHKKKSV